MKLFIDGDACPVTEDAILIAKNNQLEVVIIRSYAHFSLKNYDQHVELVYVDSENEAADYKIISMIKPYEILITQDYGLASLALQKECKVIHQKGMHYTKDNIDRLLMSRHTNAQIRKQGGRTKGPAPFTDKDRKNFRDALEMILR